MYKLIALDMDGTLLREDGSISARTQQAIADARSSGVHVVLASGRPLVGMERFLQLLALTSHEDYVLSYNGALIQNVGSGKVLSRNMLSGQDARALYQLSQQLGVNIHAFSQQRGLIAPRNSRYTEVERSHNDLTLTLVDFSTLPDDEQILKIMMVDEPELLANAMHHLPEDINSTLSAVGGMIGPASMIVTGMLFAGMDFKQIFASKRVYFVTFLRLIVVPAIALVL